ncbi:homoserine O-acetyltransferase [Limibacter armeniacum]
MQKMEAHYFHYNEDFQLESGDQLKGFTLKYCTFGKPNHDFSNVVWVCHALTGNAEVTDWWAGLFGDGSLFNPDEHFVICANVLGSCYGSTGPLSINPDTGEPYFHAFPQLTIRDIVNALDLLRESLGITHIQTLIGGSLGGQQAIEWALKRPRLMENLILAATNAVHSPWGVAFNETQRLALEADPTWLENNEKAGQNGLKAARAIAMLSYRNYNTYDVTQQEGTNENIDEFRASSYQRYQGEKLLSRFNAYSYWSLSKAMDSHNVARGRGSLQDALQNIEAYTHVIGVTTDILFPVSEQRFIARYVPNVTYEEINSTYGHDGFLVETEKIASAIKAFFRHKDKKKLVYDQGC